MYLRLLEGVDRTGISKRTQRERTRRDAGSSVPVSRVLPRVALRSNESEVEEHSDRHFKVHSKRAKTPETLLPVLFTPASLRVYLKQPYPLRPFLFSI